MATIPVAFRDRIGERAAQAASARFLLTDGNGGYLALGGPNVSNYDGWHSIAHDGTRWKILQDIAPVEPITAIDIEERMIRRRSAGSWQELRVSDRGVRMRASGSFLLTLDCKRFGDESDQGRIYEEARGIAAKGTDGQSGAIDRITVVVMSYRKHRDGRIAPDNVDSRLAIAIATTLGVDRRPSWHEVGYAYDDRRGTRSTRWVRDVALLKGEGDLAVAIGTDERDAHRRAVDLLLRPPREPERTSLPAKVAAAPLPVRLAWASLRALRARGGILAGLPWFHQRWSRDELISTGALIAAEDAESRIAAERMLDTWYSAVRPDGSLPAIHPDAGLRSADAPGWLGRRTLDLLASGHVVPAATLVRWRDAAGLLVRSLTVRDGLVWSGKNETWMDTAGDDDGREGARIEIQALALALLEAHALLCARTDSAVPQETIDLRVAIHQAVRSLLVQDSVLLDGLRTDGSPDTTVRPNLFIAWCAWPSLLPEAQWRIALWRAIDRLWLPWGGLATIDKADPRYRGRDTGEDTAAYHRGDSWYFVNAMAAMALRAVDPIGSVAAVRRLLGAIETDMLEQGYLGHVSEISSADSQEAMGCHAQAWSAACYVEAVLRDGR